MAPTKRRSKKKRPPLSRARILDAAMTLADRDGLDALSMRKIGRLLSVEAMSLYNHVANKDDILDALIDRVTDEIELAPANAHWKDALRSRARSMHDVLLRHPWAAALMESRMTMSPTRFRHHDAVIGAMRRDGFSIRLAYLAFFTLDSFIYGFMLHETNAPVTLEERPDAVEAFQPHVGADDYPHLHEMMAYLLGQHAEHRASTQGYMYEFEFGLSLVLDGLERARDLA